MKTGRCGCRFVVATVEDDDQSTTVVHKVFPFSSQGFVEAREYAVDIQTRNEPYDPTSVFIKCDTSIQHIHAATCNRDGCALPRFKYYYNGDTVLADAAPRRPRRRPRRR